MGFIGALETIRYDSPVTCEPIAGAIAALSAGSEDAVLERVTAPLDAIFPGVD